MLRYKILANDASTDKITVPVEDYRKEILDGDYFHKIKRYFVVTKNSNITKGGTVSAIHKILVDNDLVRRAYMKREDENEETEVVYYDTVNDYDDFVKSRAESPMIVPSDMCSKYEFNESMTVVDVTDDEVKIGTIFKDDENKPFTYSNAMMFTTVTDRFFKLNINKVSVFTNTTYIAFENSHFFNPTNDTINLWIHFTDNGKGINAKIECRYVNITTLKTDLNAEFCDNYGKIIEDGSERLSDIFRTLLSEESLYKTLVYMRETPFFSSKEDRTTKDDFIVYTYNPKKSITIGFSRSDGINMQQSDSVSGFIQKTKEESINRINEMEKDVYYPTIVETDGYDKDNPSDTDFTIKSDVHSIRFNLHFREHRGEDWLVSPDSYWNGTEKNGTDIVLMEDKDGARFFYDKSNPEKQSDLLSYLNFTDDDVKYRKNRLKKSFLRLSFYDSTNPANQNLLAYSTIFVDSGDLYGSYLKYGGFFSTNNSSENGKYMSLSYSGDEIVGKSGLTGIRVNREYNGEEKNVEERRLSSQFVVKDKGMTDSSSEGFYLYLWKDNDSGVLPSNIYMKVEFNHAGYGRTIPFMMPYWDRKTTRKNGIKSFQEILDDWNNKPEEGVYIKPRDRRYTVQDYVKYSYIKFKYRYDKDNERHIYYLDDTVYGDSAHFNDNAITLNLYEAKII